MVSSGLKSFHSFTLSTVSFSFLSNGVAKPYLDWLVGWQVELVYIEKLARFLQMGWWGRHQLGLVPCFRHHTTWCLAIIKTIWKQHLPTASHTWMSVCQDWLLKGVHDVSVSQDFWTLMAPICESWTKRVCLVLSLELFSTLWIAIFNMRLCCDCDNDSDDRLC